MTDKLLSQGGLTWLTERNSSESVRIGKCSRCRTRHPRALRADPRHAMRNVDVLCVALRWAVVLVTVHNFPADRQSAVSRSTARIAPCHGHHPEHPKLAATKHFPRTSCPPLPRRPQLTCTPSCFCPSGAKTYRLATLTGTSTQQLQSRHVADARQASTYNFSTQSDG